MQDELIIAVAPSRYLQIVIILQHMGGFCCVAYALWPSYFSILLLGFALSLHFAYFFKKYGLLQSRTAVLQFSLKPCGKVQLCLKNNVKVDGYVSLSNTYVSPSYIVLLINRPNHQHAVILLKDSMTSFPYQRLKAHLRAITEK
ncbi:MAG: hypothetical protein RLZ35_1185 [Pseudomonadota bacterium]|jgi:hypothetical protein